MDHQEFLHTVAQRAGISTDQANACTRATLETLAERISDGEARDLAAQLLTELQQPLRPRAEDAERFGIEEQRRRRASRHGIPTRHWRWT